MKLIKAEIVNFRSVQNATVEFDPPCRVLVGINESGKSNLLHALSLLSDEVAPSRRDDVREGLPDEDEVSEAYVKFFFRLEKADCEEVFELVSEDVLANVADPEIVTIDGKPTGLRSLCNQRSDVRYNVDLIKETKAYRHPALAANLKLNGVWKKPSASCPKDFSVSGEELEYRLSDHKLIRIKDFPAIPEDYLEDASIDELHQLLGSASIAVAKERPHDCLFWKYDEANQLPTEVPIDAFAANPASCLPLWNMFVLAGVVEVKDELARIRQLSPNQMQSFLDRVSAKTTAHFRSVWKEHKDVEFKLRIESNKLIPTIKEQNSFDFARRSDGFKRFATFLLLISADVRTDNLTDTLLLVDEPEAGLHPAGARYLRDELIRISNKNHVVYSTHSIFMIDSGNIARHYIVRKEDEITTIDEAAESNVVDEEVLFNAVGFSTFEMLRQKNIIFEGWRDKKLFMTMIEKAPADVKSKLKDVGLCHAKGVKHIKSITPMIEMARRSCVIVSDADGPAKEQQKLYRAEKGFGTWSTYKDLDSSIEAVTGEDFLKNAYLVKMVNAALEGLGLAAFTETDLAVTREKLKVIGTWLSKNGLTDEQSKDVLSKVKSTAFDNLESKHIDPAYLVLMKALAKAV